MTRIYISYARKDATEVDALIERMEAAGLEVWIDRVSIPGGTEWREKIAEGIRDCNAFAICLSPVSVTSKYVLAELNLADGQHKKILPLLIERVTIPPSMQLQLSGQQQIDFTANFEDGFERLLRALHPYPPPPEVPQAAPPPPLKRPNRLLAEILSLLVLLGLVGIVIFGILLLRRSSGAEEIPATGTATATPTAILTYTPTPSLTFTPAPTLTLTFTPYPACAQATVESIEFFLNGSWVKFPLDDSTHIALTIDQTTGLARLLGRAIFTDTNVLQHCACSWKGGASSPYANLSTPSQDCSFSAPLSGSVRQLYLFLEVYGSQPIPFVIDFP